MLSNKDVNRILEANKEVFVTKDEFNSFAQEVREGFSSLLSVVDNYAKKADAYFEEMVLMNRRIDRLEKWAQQVGEKIGVALKY